MNRFTGTTNIDDLADIRDVRIDLSLPLEEKRQQYLDQIKNPNLYRCGDTIIRVSYANTTVTLKDKLIEYLLFTHGRTLR